MELHNKGIVLQVPSTIACATLEFKHEQTLYRKVNLRRDYSAFLIIHITTNLLQALA